MKKLFRKATAILANTALIGMTVGMAAAASFPEPFTSNTAIVVGAHAVPSDNLAAGDIIKYLNANAVTTESVTVSGGESFSLDKSSNHFNFGDTLDAVYSTLDDEDMDFLAEGTYDDGDIDEDYEQSITLSAETLTLFADNDYSDDDPTVGFKWTNGNEILNYVMEYDNAISFSDMEDTDLPLFGSEYYVLSATNATDTLELLDSAESAYVAEGESVTVGDYTIAISYIGSGEVKFNVNGEITDKLSAHDSYELDDGAYIVANEIDYASKETGISKVEFSIGAGLMKIVDGEEIEINDEDVDGLIATFGKTGDDLTSITITWNSDDETFLTEEDAITMPGFEKISLAFGGLDYASDSEDISLDNGETLVLNMGNYELDLMWYNGAATVMGAEDHLLSLAIGDNVTDFSQMTGTVSTGIELAEDGRFIVTYLDDDLSNVETAYYEVSNIDWTSDTDFTLELTDLIGEKDVEISDDMSDTEEFDEFELQVLGMTASAVYLNFTGSNSLSYNTAVSDKGLFVTLPTSSNITAVASDEYSIVTFQEANDDEDVGTDGATFTATVKLTSNDKLHVSATSVSTEEESADDFIGYVDSSLASIINTDESGDEYDFSIEYFGKEVSADVMVVADGSIGSSTDAGVMSVKDNEVATVAGMNLIVVGGSAINTVAAELLGGAYSEAAFTSATGVGAGEFLIESFDRAGKTALLVAGYNAADTEKAATYLLNMDVDTDEGMKMKGTSATEATVVTA